MVNFITNSHEPPDCDIEPYEPLFPEDIDIDIDIDEGEDNEIRNASTRQ